MSSVTLKEKSIATMSRQLEKQIEKQADIDKFFLFLRPTTHLIHEKVTRAEAEVKVILAGHIAI